MKKRQIINIVNFIRGVEPRETIDLVSPVVQQISLIKKHNLKGTFLIQYNAMLDKNYSDLLLELDLGQFEIGIWFEFDRHLVEKAGIEWRGRYEWDWDWQSNCGFSVGYTNQEREKLIDTFFEGFKSIFGYFPRVFGAWIFDSHSLDYANNKYGLDAACNCKDQWGTDGYTLWGGYYGQGYYPSRLNSFCPAQTKENQINTPILRMLGSDPIYQYDAGLNVNQSVISPSLGVITLEPVYNYAGGGVNEWVDWYLKENFSGNCLTFGYAQAGQENSFGWSKMKNGLEYQFFVFEKLVKEGKIEVETMGDTGIWFKNTFKETPPSTIAALTDWKDNEGRSIWYNCKNYRINLYAEKGRFWIRDIYLFRETFKDKYLDEICTTADSTYDNLPIIDGTRFSGNGIRGGLYPSISEKNEYCGIGMDYDEILYDEKDGSAIIKFTNTLCGDITFILTETGFDINITGEHILILNPKYNENANNLPEVNRISANELQFSYNNYTYNIKLSEGEFNLNNAVCTKNGKLSFVLDLT